LLLNFAPSLKSGGAFVAKLHRKANFNRRHIEATDMEGFSPIGDSIKMKLPVIGSLRARAGLAFDSILIYGTGGLAGAAADYSTTIQGINSKENGTLWGYTVGGGIELGLSEKFTAGIEYRYTDFGNERYRPEVLECSIGPDPVPCDFVTPTSFHAVRATVSYHF
jgi:outer membrane immunogenic protein